MTRKTLAGLVLIGLSAGYGVASAPVSGALTNEEAARKAQWWLSGLGVDQAQTAARGGEGVTVCLVDSGVNKDHADLRGAKFEGGTDQSGAGASDGLKPVRGPEDEHGTAMAAWIVGQGHGPGHSLGIRGVAPKATLMSVSVKDGPDSYDPAVKYCLDHGAKVVNLSTYTSVSPKVVDEASRRDAVIVHGAGNYGSQNGCVQTFLVPGELGVGGVLKDLSPDTSVCTNRLRKKLSDYPADSAMRVRFKDYTANIAVAGPSNGPRKDAKSGYPLLIAAGGGSGYVLSGGGTSTATAVTSGVVALVRAAHPELKAGDVINRVLRTAKVPGGSDRGVGPDGVVGFGVVDAARAVSADVPRVGVNPLGDPLRADSAAGMPGNPRGEGVAQGAAGSQGANASSGVSSGGFPVWGWGVVGVGVVVLLGGVVFAATRRQK